MYKIQFWLELHPRTCWGSLQHSSDTQLDLMGLFKGASCNGKGEAMEGNGGTEEEGTGLERREGPSPYLKS